MQNVSSQVLVNALASRINLHHKVPSLSVFATDAHKKVAQDAIADVVFEVQEFIAETIGREEAKDFASRCLKG